jgi:hypothetical protein
MTNKLFQTNVYIQQSSISPNQSIHLIFLFYHSHYLNLRKGPSCCSQNVTLIMLYLYLIFQWSDNLYLSIPTTEPSDFNFGPIINLFLLEILLLMLSIMLIILFLGTFPETQPSQFHSPNFILQYFFKKWSSFIQ